MQNKKSVPVIDLFAGPGGLCEGFTSFVNEEGQKPFNVRVSIEKDAVAHQTLLLRSVFRHLSAEKNLTQYYDYIKGAVNKADFFNHPEVKRVLDLSKSEARCAELGTKDNKDIDKWIASGINNSANWVLIGGPPCQAYSLAGRSRMRGLDPKAFENDKRHFLYTEYLRIIRKFGPPVFVMENVKGILTSQHGGSLIFEKILDDLKNPGNGLKYEIQSLVVPGEISDPSDFIIKSENFGIPQCRHRVILLGVRTDLKEKNKNFLSPTELVIATHSSRLTVAQALAGLPAIRSQVSNRNGDVDSTRNWQNTLKDTIKNLKHWRSVHRTDVEEVINKAIVQASSLDSTGEKFISCAGKKSDELPQNFFNWYHDKELDGVIQHESRSHMRSDLQRYMFASSFAKITARTPKLADFPPKL
jgi:DNA (cytosine-5)-methyltransferase 1